MKTLFLLLLAILFSPAFAATKLDLRPKAQKLEDPGSATPLIYKKPEQTEALKPKKGLQIGATCTDTLGMIVKAGDPGYESCLRNAGKTKVQNTNEKNPNSVGITIGN